MFAALSTPDKSEIRWLQALGRGLRTAPGKDACLIFDHSGTVHRLASLTPSNTTICHPKTTA
jgi:superfamily II DNA or RNA helicase